jgi:hypothetical protein
VHKWIEEQLACGFSNWDTLHQAKYGVNYEPPNLAWVLDDPKAGKALKEDLKGLRIARLRIVYRIGKGEVVEIVAFGPRYRIYEETLSLVRREER